jgi:hypothetical protein
MVLRVWATLPSGPARSSCQSRSCERPAAFVHEVAVRNARSEQVVEVGVEQCGDSGVGFGVHLEVERTQVMPATRRLNDDQLARSGPRFDNAEGWPR